MARNFPDFIKAYLDYAKDDYCPDEFHRWTGMSILAGALERKVWLINGKITFFPNVYVFLVTFAGVGKSTALVRGTDFLEELKEKVTPEFNIIDEQITEPAFVKTMSERQLLQMPGTTGLFHSSGYFYASEASASALQNTCGNFVATVTGFYDCPKVFRKTTLSGGPLEFYNVCFNMLAGATFDYLRTLVNDVSVMGGFASRILYVVSKERIIRTPKWGASDREDAKMREALFADLKEIHALKGAFKPSKEFVSAWEAFQPESDRILSALNSPRLESLAARRSTHVTKVAMLLSASESNDMTLEARHWDRAMELVEDVMKDNAFILSQGAIADKTSQLGVTQALGQMLKRRGGQMSMQTFKGAALAHGNPVDLVTKTIDFMIASAWISYDASSGNVKLLVDPDRYL